MPIRIPSHISTKTLKKFISFSPFAVGNVPQTIVKLNLNN